MSRASAYGPGDYDAMFADALRTPPYLAAIASVVRAGDVVVEVGTGVGYFAVAACRAGARRVYAIEREASVLLAEQVARENGYGDRIVCIRGDANRVTLPEKATVMISDLRGMLPLLGNAIPTIASVRERLLVAGGRMIPLRDVIRAAPCGAPSHWRAIELALGTAPSGIARTAVAAHARAYMHRAHFTQALLCGPPADVATLHYESVTSPDVDAELSWTIDREDRIEGIGLWFDAQLTDSIGFSTAPGGPNSVYGNPFLPLERAVDAKAGDRLDCRLRARLLNGEYLFAWDTTFTPAGAGRPAVTMRQSTLGALLASQAELERHQASFVPDTAQLAVTRDWVAMADGRRTLAEIAEALALAHPARFASNGQALAWVTQRHAEAVGDADG